jgi:hypothetical protein
MKKSSSNKEKINEKEALRIGEIKKLSYAQRLENFLKLMELSYALKNAPKVYPNKK